MHKKLEAELIHLAHQVLKMNNTTDINTLRDKARLIYENLAALTFIDNYFVDTPEVTDSKEDFLESLNQLVNKKVVNKVETVPEKASFVQETPKKEEIVIEKTPKPVEKTTPKVEEAPKAEEVVKEKEAPKVKEDEKVATEQLIQKTLKTVKTEAKEIASKIEEKTQTTTPKVAEKNSLEDEMKDSISADVAANMFERAEKISTDKVAPLTPNTDNKAKIEKEDVLGTTSKTEKPKVNIATKQEIFKPKPTPTPSATSLNDRIHNQKIQVGLNDRIAFVKHLFNFSQEEFNRVLSQLNTFNSEQECKDFLNTQVKPEYDWSNKEEYEERLIALIERKFK